MLNATTRRQRLDHRHATSKLRAAISGIGTYLPERILTNAEIEETLDTSNEWIIERTGIRERRIAAPEESTSTLAAHAATRACESGGFDPADLELIIVATITPDHLFPSTACLVQAQIGAKKAACFDLNAACTGFIYATTTASAFVSSGMYRNVLVIGAETLSRFVDYEDRSTCILFGDGAGAALLRASSSGQGVAYCSLGADGERADLLQIPGGGSKNPPSLAMIEAKQQYMQLEGGRVFRFATEMLIKVIREAMDTCGLSRDDIGLVVPHQVNRRIIDAAMRKLDLPSDKWAINIDCYGNTSSASIPIAMVEAYERGQLEPGTNVILAGVGAGLTWGATVVKM